MLVIIVWDVPSLPTICSEVHKHADNDDDDAHTTRTRRLGAAHVAVSGLAQRSETLRLSVERHECNTW